ncbi:hypothetical protein [Verrucosispora sp. TAA-831]|uniref:hypothetical protein n=1 Tax=Verrucosispora sp. TAA-831 TaxID=3422227 RepID=UPI003D6F5644
MTDVYDPGRKAQDMESRYTQHHIPVRPSWDCTACGEPWPCETARARLLAAYGPDVTNLSQYLGGHYHDALEDMPADAARGLHMRIIGWVRRAQPVQDAICGGCHPLPTHDCVGTALPTDDLRYRCVCPQEACRVRQGRAPATTGVPAAAPVRRATRTGGRTKRA